MDEETKTIEKTVKISFENMKSIENHLIELNAILDRVALRETEVEEHEEKKPNREPQTLTEKLVLLQETAFINACAVEKLRNRAGKLF